MAAAKKATAKVEEPKTTAAKKAADTKTAASVQAEKEKEETVKGEAAEAKKTEEKAAEVKKTAGRGRKAANSEKAELQSELHIQFSGKSYTQDELVKIAKDVWKYDLKEEVEDLESLELYVKPEEHAVYYVMNKEVTGSFYI